MSLALSALDERVLLKGFQGADPREAERLLLEARLQALARRSAETRPGTDPSLLLSRWL